jgi:hypothetical protein
MILNSFKRNAISVIALVSSSAKCFNESEKDKTHFARYLTTNKSVDNVGMMSWPSMTEGLSIRRQDESKLRELLQNRSTMNISPDIISNLLYGDNCSIEDREFYIEKYGCTRYTTECLDAIASSIKEGRYTGIVEMGAGHGQWARVLRDLYNIDIVAFDSMTNLPLANSDNKGNKSIHKYYYNVIKGNEQLLASKELISKYNIQRRALLLIYPDPSNMAIECLKKYVDIGAANDMVIYAGEGRKGANCNEDFFNELESKRWKLLRTCELMPFGNKGYERLFIFKRI